MQQQDDLRGLAKIMDFMKAISILFVILNIYWFCYESFAELDLTLNILDKILLNFNRTTGLFNNVIWTKLFAFVFLALACLGNQAKKEEKITWGQIYTLLISGAVLFFLNWWILYLPVPASTKSILYIITISGGYILMLWGGVLIGRMTKVDLLKDPFNEENESFQQESELITNEYSINLPTRYYYRGKEQAGWINVVNPFRASAVLGTPGSGKSFAIVNNYIKQEIEKGFALYIYDFKFPDLSEIAYNHLLTHQKGYKVVPKFYVINFDNPRKSHRCNPIHPRFMTDISDAYESAYTIMLNLNRSWTEKQGDFFVESPIVLLAAIIWFLKIYKDGKYCTFPHALEFLNKPLADIFSILTSYEELENYLSAFIDAFQSGAQDQLQGQVASAKIPLSRLISPQLYWVMSADDFTLDINNPQDPKILVVGNNPDRQAIYSAALGLYNSRITKLINKKKQLKCGIVIDELPTIFFKGLDTLIATARSNKVAVCLGFQDSSQLIRDYGEKEAKVILNTVGNIFAGQVLGDTAKNLSERFGKIVQQRQSLSINRDDKSTSINTQLESLIPASKISTLAQGEFVGAVCDNFSEKIKQKVFHAEIVVDVQQVEQETQNYKPIPDITSFIDPETGEDRLQEQINFNYKRIKVEVSEIVRSEMDRIKNDPNAKQVNKEEEKE